MSLKDAKPRHVPDFSPVKNGLHSTFPGFIKGSGLSGRGENERAGLSSIFPTVAMQDRCPTTSQHCISFRAQQSTHVLHNFGPYEVAKMRTDRVQPLRIGVQVFSELMMSSQCQIAIAFRQSKRVGKKRSEQIHYRSQSVTWSGNLGLVHANRGTMPPQFKSNKRPGELV
ncbi:unnamed protein product [Leuciscus chuanchicus]